MTYKLPDPIYSWAWSGQYIALATENKTEAGLILPSQPQAPAYCHFSRLSPEGEEIAWLWLFSTPIEAASLRMMQAMQVQDALADLVELTIPTTLPDCSTPTYLQPVDLSYLAGQPLQELGIHEVWLGFNYKRYAAHRSMVTAADLVLPTDEFIQKARLCS